jgi:small multidrug resistance pump
VSAALACLALAIASEVAATLTLRSTSARPLLWPVVLAGYAFAFWLLARSLAVLPIAPVYAVWAGVGTAAVAAAGWWLFGERLSAGAVTGIVLVVAGVVLLGATTQAGS